ncbi:MAG: hypothetical protein U1E65_23560 [Myxococcota bacterium]
MARTPFSLLLIPLLLPGLALAESPEELLKRGVELRRAHKDEEALAAFQAAHQAAPSPRTLGQMGFAEQALKRFPEAYQHILAALAAPSDPWVQKNQEALADSKAALEREVGEIVVEAAGARLSGVQVDERPRLEPGAPIFATKGPHQLRVEAEDAAPLTLKLDVKPGQKNRLLASFAAASTAELTSRAGSADDGETLRTLGYVGLGLGAAGFIVMAIGIGVRSGPSEELNGPACFGDPFLCPDQASAVSSADAMIAVGAVAGSLFLAGGVTMLVLAPSGADDAVASLRLSPAGLRVQF